ncbi:hypothetical protein V6Z11_D10G127300 [Gossypium hirsutum]|uniref:Serine/threonine-protein phosphatase 5 isoform X1 n=3 Tax=Gossypium TaxID=3633 RepID=A0A1U8K8Y3_GOSHI|nr:serine/threonine-protein phosphatase 5-like isoform X1 [Gossypium hirsutum]TYH49436.1 hypothetical protein ES332_D10G136400v1 [Gossypium tomentosum]
MRKLMEKLWPESHIRESAECLKCRMFIVKCMYEDYDSDFCNIVVFNCAEAHTKFEEYGSAIQNATKAIEVDPKYSKGYYRRGAAYLAMGKFKEALKDFQQVLRLIAFHYEV